MSTATTENKKQKFANLLGPTDRALDAKIREKLITGRVGLLIKQPFFGNLATRLKLTNADEWCSTAATDGRNFYYNSRFIDMLRPKEVEFLFGHEVLHCCYDHFGRRGERDGQLFNIANDYAVNADLKKHRVGEMITTVPALYDSKFEGWSSEQIYDYLYENAEKISMEDLLDKLIDEHLDGDDDDGDSKGDKDGNGKKGRPRLSEEERQKIRDEMKEAMINAANQAGAGNIPAGVARMIKDITEPKMNWRELLRMQLQSTIKTDFTWMRPSRRGWDMDAVMPGMRNEDAIDIAVFIDASGSIGDKMLRDFLGEIQGIMESFESYKIHVVTFDTHCYNPVTYDSDNLDDICDYDVKGGGGTDFECIFDYLKDSAVEPKKLVVFTDGLPFGSWGDPNYCDTVWIIHSNPGCQAPFGLSAEYDKQDKH